MGLPLRHSAHDAVGWLRPPRGRRARRCERRRSRGIWLRYDSALARSSARARRRPMPNEKQIRALARKALEDGRLPRRDPDGTWGGKGADVPCAICGERIRPDHLETSCYSGLKAPRPARTRSISTFAASRRGRWNGRSSMVAVTRRRSHEALGFRHRKQMLAEGPSWCGSSSGGHSSTIELASEVHGSIRRKQAWSLAGIVRKVTRDPSSPKRTSSGVLRRHQPRRRPEEAASPLGRWRCTEFDRIDRLYLAYQREACGGRQTRRISCPCERVTVIRC